MEKKRLLDRVFCFFAVLIGSAIIIGAPIKFCVAAPGIYNGDSFRVTIKGYVPSGQPVPYGTNVKGVLFDGYPQIVKQEASKPTYKVKVEKDIMVAMRDGVRLAVDVYRPDVESEKFPAILAWGMWGKDAQAAIAWMGDKQQPYYDSPFWDGTMEAGNFMYTVPRGYAHVIPDPRGIGNSEGNNLFFESYHDPKDIYDTIEWIAKQPWCTGKVGMMGPSSYSVSQMNIVQNPPPHLIAIHPDEGGEGSDYFNGVWDTTLYHIFHGRHGNDSTPPPANNPQALPPPKMLNAPDIEQRLQEALNHPDIKYNTKWYSTLKYPMKFPPAFDGILESFHPRPIPDIAHRITLPLYLGTPWITNYIWRCFESFEKATTPERNKKIIFYPPGYNDRPYAQYHDEIVRWYDYWLKGIDNGILDEPPIKLFVMGINKWKFENEWPLARTDYTKYYLHPGGRLSTDTVKGSPDPESFTQPAPYLDPIVYCLRYNTEPLEQDMELTGHIVLNLDASIDIDDTNWMADLVDVDQEGNKQWLSVGYLKAKFRALDKEKSKPYYPVHLRQDPVPIHPGEIIQYSIAMMPTSVVLQKGHSLELIIRNQDDILSRLGTWGRYVLPFMQTVTHNIHFGKSHLLLPVIPAK